MDRVKFVHRLFLYPLRIRAALFDEFSKQGNSKEVPPLTFLSSLSSPKPEIAYNSIDTSFGIYAYKIVIY